MTIELATRPLPHPEPGAARLQQPVVPARGRTHGLSLIFWLLEQRRTTLLALWLAAAAPAALLSGGRWWIAAAAFVAVPLVGIITPLFYLVWR